MRKFLRLIPVVVIFAVHLTATAIAKPPSVVVSLPPIHSLATGVMTGVAVPHLLVRGSRSPHDAALRPSDIRRLRHADVIVWVGPRLESFLVKPLAALDTNTAVLTLIDEPKINRLRRRAAGVWYEQDHAQPAEYGLSHQFMDMHIWLSPANARTIVERFAILMSRHDGGNAETYAANARRLAKRISAAEASLASVLVPLRGAPYILFHDAYQYFERYFGLKAAGAIATSPNRPIGARRLAEIRRLIHRTGARCIFREPQFSPRLLATVAKNTAARIGVLDPLGSAIAPGADQWFSLMKGLGDGLNNCLGSNVQ